LRPGSTWAGLVIVAFPVVSSFTALAFIVVLSALIRLFFSIVISLAPRIFVFLAPQPPLLQEACQSPDNATQQISRSK
jgi:hypothetical protein